MRYPLRSMVILTLFFLFVMTISERLGGRQGLLAGFIFFSFFLTLFLWGTDYFIQQVFSGVQLKGQDPWNILVRNRQVAASVKIPPPEIWLVPQSVPWAASVGVTWRHAKIFLSQGFFERLSADEQASILTLLAKEAERGIPVAMRLLFCFLCLVWLPLQMVLGPLKANPKTAGFGHRSEAWLLRVLGKPFVGLLCPAKHSMGIERLAALHGSDPEVLSKAIYKIHGWTCTRPLPVPPLYHCFLVAPPQDHVGFRPPLSRRIQNLIGRFPI